MEKGSGSDVKKKRVSMEDLYDVSVVRTSPEEIIRWFKNITCK